jgi:hypothetical protein
MAMDHFGAVPVLRTGPGMCCSTERIAPMPAQPDDSTARWLQGR